MHALREFRRAAECQNSDYSLSFIDGHMSKCIVETIRYSSDSVFFFGITFFNAEFLPKPVDYFREARL